MSEDAPQFTPTNGEQHPIVPEGQESAAEDIGSVAVDEEPTKIAVQDGESTTEDTRWDEDKARTVGIAAKESDYVGERYPITQDNRAFDNSRLNRKRSFNESEDRIDEQMDAQHSGLATRLRGAKSQLERAEAEGEVPEEDWKREEVRLRQAEYDAALPEMRDLAREIGREDTEKWEQRREEAIEEITSPFEELYDLAPEVFAQMPTNEFIAATREFISLKEKIVEESNGLRTIEIGLDEMQKRLEKRQPVNWDLSQRRIIFYGNISGFAEEVASALEHDTITEAVDKYKAVFADSFDKTPRQIVEGCIQVTDEYVKQAAEKLQEALRQKQEFLEKYGVKTEPEEPETATTPSESVN